MLIGKILKENRRHNALSQEQVAIKLHVSHQTVSSWEQDRTRPEKIAQIYHLPKSANDLIAKNPTKNEGINLLILVLAAFLIPLVGWLLTLIIVQRNKSTNSYYRLIYSLCTISIVLTVLDLISKYQG
ncbi:helix-turn-helix domain-containing protein [Oenococcus sicerae]|uniref:helix-turn-helix domain-containing protein n=1 Tax=Oenococcus sicerae TaxID=2203724 RepID=UPI0010B53BE6|nr:hypothetical protein OAL24_01637 [Oenococcus sicerae]